MELADTLQTAIANGISLMIWAGVGAWAVGIGVFIAVQLYKIIIGIRS